MKTNRLFVMFGIAVLLFSATIIHAGEQNPIVSTENKTAVVDEFVKVNVTMTEAPEGLSGYNLTIALSNSLVAEIVSVEFPDWAILNAKSTTLPADSVWIKAVDLHKQVEKNATNVQIASLLVKTKSTGTSAITVTKIRIDDDSGYTIAAITETGYISVTDSAASDNLTVSIPSSSAAAPVDTAIVPITVHNVTDLGAGTLTVTYDPEVCTVTDVTAGDFSTVTKNISVPGIAILSTMGTQGHTGDVDFANLEIKAVGSCGETSYLDLTVETLKTYGPPVETIPPAAIRVKNGTFTIQDDLAPSVTNPSANPATILNDNSRPRIPGTNRTQLNVTVTDTTGVDTVTIDLLPIGGSAAEKMTNIPRTNIWTVTVNAPTGINHTHNLVVTATDTSGNSDTSVSVPLTVLRRGDVLRDDVVDIGDALYLLQWTTGAVSDPGALVGDVSPATGDGSVDAGDALYIVQWTTREVPEP